MLIKDYIQKIYVSSRSITIQSVSVSQEDLVLEILQSQTHFEGVNSEEQATGTEAKMKH